jgi:hypothetical protein
MSTVITVVLGFCIFVGGWWALVGGLSVPIVYVDFVTGEPLCARSPYSGELMSLNQVVHGGGYDTEYVLSCPPR